MSPLQKMPPTIQCINSAPSKYAEAGGHLFAAATQCPADLGYGGYLYFDAKNTELAEYYSRQSGARRPGIYHQYRMDLGEAAAQGLLTKHTLQEW